MSEVEKPFWYEHIPTYHEFLETGGFRNRHVSRFCTLEQRKSSILVDCIFHWLTKYKSTFGVAIPGEEVTQVAEWLGTEFFYERFRRYFRAHVEYEGDSEGGLKGNVNFRLNINKKTMGELDNLRDLSFLNGLRPPRVINAILPQRFYIPSELRTVSLSSQSFGDFLTLISRQH